MLRNFLFSVPFVLLNLRAPEGTQGGGGSGTPAPADTAPAWAPSAEAPAATGDSIEAKLESSTGIIGTLFKNLGLAFTAFKQVTGEKKQLETQFNSLKETAQAEKDEHAKTKGLLETEKNAHTETTGKLDKANKSVERLESLCDLKGLDKNEVIKPSQSGAGATGNALANEYLELKKKEAKGEVKRGSASRFYSKNKKEIDAATAE